MFKAKRRKSVFLSAAVLAILLGTVLIGSTFASNVGYSGDADPVETAYNVDFEYHNGNGNYLPLKDNSNLTQNTLWCPGRTEILYIRLQNDEKFTANCTLTLNVTDTGFGETLTYAIYDGDLKKLDTPPKSWPAFKGMARTLEGGVNDVVLSKKEHKLLNKEQLDPEEELYLALAIHMDENASSIYEGKTLKYDLVLQIDANYQPGETPTK